MARNNVCPERTLAEFAKTLPKLQNSSFAEGCWSFSRFFFISLSYERHVFLANKENRYFCLRLFWMWRYLCITLFIKFRRNLRIEIASFWILAELWWIFSFISIFLCFGDRLLFFWWIKIYVFCYFIII